MTNNYKPHIDGLRAIAVFSVIFFHLEPVLIPGGFLGVDIFFVISGFLIAKIIINKIQYNQFKITDFFISRARRILPMLLFILIFFFPLNFFLIPYKLIDISQSALTGIFFSSNFLFYLETGYFGEEIQLKPFIHLWSLSVEEQFYLVFPIICIFFYKKKNYFYSILILGLCTSLFLSSYIGNNFQNANFFLTPTRAWEIMIGICFAIFERNKILNFLNKYKNFLLTLSLVLIIFSFFYFNESDKLPNIKILPLTIFTGLIIVLCDEKTLVYKILSNKFLVFFGLISYSLYMLHQPILAYNKNLNLLDETFEFKILFIILLIIFSSLTWKFIEQPFRNYNKIKNKTFFKIIFSSLFFLILINTFVLLSDGLAMRYGNHNKDLALINPLEKGRYVQKKFNIMMKKNFKFYDKKNILVLGDSHAEDFINMVYENNYFDGYNVKTSKLTPECYLKFLKGNNGKIKKKLEKCNENILKDIEFSNIIFLINSIGAGNKIIIDNFKEIFESTIFDNKKIFIIGTKMFQKPNFNKLLKLTIEEKQKYTFNLPKKRIELEKKKELLVSKISNVNYIDIFKTYCETPEKCKLFDNNLNLIAYDGAHLTKEGAKYLGKNLFSNTKLIFLKDVNFIDE